MPSSSLIQVEIGVEVGVEVEVWVEVEVRVEVEVGKIKFLYMLYTSTDG